MEFYFLRDTSDTKIIGKFPQLEKMFDGFHGQHIFEAWGLFNSRTSVPMKAVKGFEIKYHAKMTDWISFVQVGFGAALISERLYDLFLSFKSMPFIAVDAEVNHRNKAYAYKFLYFTETYEQFIDFNKSRFYVGRLNWEKNIEIKSLSAYQMAQESLEQEIAKTGKISRVKILELHIDPDLADKDLFKLPFLTQYIVSERLKAAIETNGITGLIFEPAQGHKFHVLDYSQDPPREIL